MKIGVLAVQGAVSEHMKMLKKCNVDVAAIKNSEEINTLSGLVIPGGESTTIGKLVEHFGLTEPIKNRVAEGKLAVFGPCAGMVLM